MIMRFFGQKNPAKYDEETGSKTRTLPPMADNNMLRGPIEFISLPAIDIPALAAKYASAMETQKTNDWCRCQWIVHPDDEGIARGNCRECNKPSKAQHHLMEEPESFSHVFKGVRLRRGDAGDDCPVHTKEGFLIYFFEWVFKQ